VSDRRSRGDKEKRKEWGKGHWSSSSDPDGGVRKRRTTDLGDFQIRKNGEEKSLSLNAGYRKRGPSGRHRKRTGTQICYSKRKREWT